MVQEHRFRYPTDIHGQLKGENNKPCPQLKVTIFQMQWDMIDLP